MGIDLFPCSVGETRWPVIRPFYFLFCLLFYISVEDKVHICTLTLCPVAQGSHIALKVSPVFYIQKQCLHAEHWPGFL